MKAVSKRITGFNEGLVPEMVQIKYQLLAQNMFSFFRGTCHLFYEDLKKERMFPKSPNAWICGDLHLENFGSYKGNNGLVYFDLNDFDECILAPAAWEVARIITSIFVGFKSLDIEPEKAKRMAQLFLKTYSATLTEGKARYIERKIAKGIVQTFLDNASKRKRKRLLKKRTEKNNDSLSIILNHPRHFELDAALKRELNLHISEWIQYNNDGPYNYEVIDSAFRLAGTGSVGVKRYVFLLKSVGEKEKYLLIDMKQCKASSVAPYVKISQPKWNSEAERVVAIQQRVQNIPPSLLSHSTFKGEPYLIQELQPVKDSINFNLLKQRYRDIYQVIDDMAMLTASAQLRSSGRQGSANADELIAFAENESWQQKILNYAINYTRKTEQYYQGFRSDFETGIFQDKTTNP